MITVSTASRIECTEDTRLQRVVNETAAVELHSTPSATQLSDTLRYLVARIRSTIVIFRVSNLEHVNAEEPNENSFE